MTFRTKEIPLNGKLITSVDGITVGQNFVILQNLRYTDANIRAVSGMTKINSTALTNPKVRSGFHYTKEQPAESHILVQNYNSGETSSTVLQNTTAIPSAGDFSATALHTDSTGADVGRFSQAPGGAVAYCNGVDTMIWGGNEYPVAAYINYDPDGAFKYDYTDNVLNSSTSFTASFAPSAAGIDSNVMLLLHLDNNVTDSSPTTPHTVTNNNVIFDATNKVFGTHAASFNGSNAYLTVPDNADFDFSGGAFTIDLRARVTSAGTNSLYYQWVDILSLAFTSGSEEPSIGDTLVGAIGGATAILHQVVLDSGTWGGGDAAGTLYLTNQTGTFQTENVNIQGGTSNVLSVGGDSSDYGDDYIHLYIDSNGAINFEIFEAYDGGATVVNIVTPDSTISTNTWYHIELVESANNWYIFVDGIQRGGGSDTDRAENYQSVVQIGYDGTNFYTGQMDEYRVSNIARDTSNFEPLTAAYSASSTNIYYYLASVRPIQGFKEYVGTANTATSSRTVEYWDGSAWTSVTTLVDGTASGGVVLAQTGSVTFDDTDGSAKPHIIDQIYVYWYRISISEVDTAATVYYVTVDAAFQTVKDLWDGTERQVALFWQYKTAVENHTLNVSANDYSSENTATYADISSLTSSNHIWAGFVAQTAGVFIYLVEGNVNTTAGTVLTVEYWNGSAWAELTISDGTISGGTSFGKSGAITWTPPAETVEFKRAIGTELKLYYYRFGFSNTLSGSVYIDKMSGITAPKTVHSYKFPIFAQKSLWLCSETYNKKNSVLISKIYTNVVFNGDDSIELTFGDDSELTAGGPLYSQFGSSLYNLTIITKKKETWVVVGSGPEDFIIYRASSVIGCVAPLTFKIITINDRVPTGTSRQLAIWQGADGVYMFDGRIFRQIHTDIADKFDRTKTSPINLSYIDKSVGFWDSVHQEYHWCFASGSSTTLNEEWAYDVLRDKWYEIVRSAYLQCAIEVNDTSGNQYTYGFIDTGYMERLENGTDWDGADMTFTFQLGDIALEQGSVIFDTDLRKVKLFGVAKTTTTNSITLTHYGDTSSSGIDYSMSPTQSGKRIFSEISGMTHKNTYHSLKFSITTDDETVGFEPIFLVMGYNITRQNWLTGQ